MPALQYSAPTPRRPATPTLALAMTGATTGAAPRLVRRADGPIPPAALDALLDALVSERRLLDDLAATMRRQRTAVGADDLPSVDDSVFATHRILATLGQARTRRRQINRLLVGIEELPARDLDEALGDYMSDALRAARDELVSSAAALAREVDVNRRVLRDALSTGDAQARVLAGTGPAAEMPNGGALLDRTG